MMRRMEWDTHTHTLRGRVRAHVEAPPSSRSPSPVSLFPSLSQHHLQPLASANEILINVLWCGRALRLSCCLTALSLSLSLYLSPHLFFILSISSPQSIHLPRSLCLPFTSVIILSSSRFSSLHMCVTSSSLIKQRSPAPPSPYRLLSLLVFYHSPKFASCPLAFLFFLLLSFFSSYPILPF